MLEVPRAHEGHGHFTVVDGVLPHPVLDGLHAVQRITQISGWVADGRVFHGSVSEDRGCVINGFGEEEIPEWYFQFATQFDELIHRSV